MQQIVMDLKKMSSSNQYGLFEVLEKINDYCLKVGTELKNFYTRDEIVDRCTQMMRNNDEIYKANTLAFFLNQNKETNLFFCDFEKWENYNIQEGYVPLCLPINDKSQLVDITINQLHLN